MSSVKIRDELQLPQSIPRILSSTPTVIYKKFQSKPMLTVAHKDWHSRKGRLRIATFGRKSSGATKRSSTWTGQTESGTTGMIYDMIPSTCQDVTTVVAL